MTDIWNTKGGRYEAQPLRTKTDTMALWPNTCLGMNESKDFEEQISPVIQLTMPFRFCCDIPPLLWLLEFEGPPPIWESPLLCCEGTEPPPFALLPAVGLGAGPPALAGGGGCPAMNISLSNRVWERENLLGEPSLMELRLNPLIHQYRLKTVSVGLPTGVKGRRW
jgi:hypothetical protein